MGLRRRRTPCIPSGPGVWWDAKARLGSPPRRKPEVSGVCGLPEAAEHRPFCSRRCANLDLGRWLKGAYRIPTEEESEPTEEPPPEEG
jgi:endogenous inhibitor of DNA gyrase (YacG/DUF329 family)